MFAAEHFEGLDRDSDLSNDEVTQQAYQKGVPMGSDYSKRAEQLEFLVWARKDADRAKLDRIQIIKLWLDEQGKSHEKVFNVAVSEGREIDRQGNTHSVGNTVNTKSASYNNNIGSEYLQTIWRDPEFKPDQQAVYYARVLEIPTPRWSTYDAKALGIEAIEPTSIQERAISSAVWYQPK
jgi:hypothetical protein